MVRVLIADDHDVIRRGLRRLIEGHAGWEVCGEAANASAALEQAAIQQPDVAILDVSMPGESGIDLARELRITAPDTELLIFTMNESDEMVCASIDAGARGYVVKSDPTSEVVAAIQALADHKPHFTTTISEAVRKALSDGGAMSGDPSQALSAREREITRLLAEGKTNKDVADLLQISPKTVDTHRAAIMRKLELKSVVELVHYAIRNKMISP